VSADVTVRPARAADVPALAELCAVVHELHVSARPAVFNPVDADGARRFFHFYLAEALGPVLLAEVDGAPAGYVVVRRQSSPGNIFAKERRWLEIDQLAVGPAFRRRGVGRALVDRVAAIAAEGGFGELELNTWAFNTEAHAFFERVGFSPRTLKFARTLAPQ
jgi:GNAT superfamily N-acetyltransferase